MAKLLIPLAIILLIIALLKALFGDECFGCDNEGEFASLPISTEAGDNLLEPVDAVAADINGDGLDDLVIVNGSDKNENSMLLEPVVVLYNRGSEAEYAFAPFTTPGMTDHAPEHAWYSETEQMYTKVCVLYLSNDECPDIIATHFESVDGENRYTAEIFINEADGDQCTGLKEPPQKISASYPDGEYGGAGWSCIGGDFDADGDDDLAMAEASRETLGDPTSDSGWSVVHVNSGVGLVNSWQAVIPDVARAMDIAITDVTADGLLDLVGSMTGVKVFKGDGTNFATTADLSWSVSNQYTMGVDTQWIGEIGDGVNVIAVAGNNESGPSKDYGYNRIFRVCEDESDLCELWQSPNSGQADDIVAMDLDDDQALDAASVRWTPQECGSDSYDPDKDRSYLYESVLNAPGDPRKMGEMIKKNILGQSIFTWSYDEIETRSFRVTVEAGQKILHFHTDDVPQMVLSVADVVDEDDNKLYFRYTANNDWLALVPAPTNSVEVTVTVTTAMRPDLVIVDACGYVHFLNND